MLSWVAVRRRLDVIFVGIVTLVFSLVCTNLLIGGRELTGGETGLLVESAAGTFLRSRAPAHYSFLVVLCGYLALYRFLGRSHLGSAMLGPVVGAVVVTVVDGPVPLRLTDEVDRRPTQESRNAR